MKISWIPELRNPTGKTLTWPQIPLWVLLPFDPSRAIRDPWGQRHGYWAWQGTFDLMNLIQGPEHTPLPTRAFCCLHSGLAPSQHRAVREVLIVSETVWKKAGRNLSAGSGLISWELLLRWGSHPLSLPELCCSHACARSCTLVDPHPDWPMS